MIPVPIALILQLQWFSDKLPQPFKEVTPSFKSLLETILIFSLGLVSNPWKGRSLFGIAAHRAPGGPVVNSKASTEEVRVTHNDVNGQARNPADRQVYSTIDTLKCTDSDDRRYFMYSGDGMAQNGDYPTRRGCPSSEIQVKNMPSATGFHVDYCKQSDMEML